MAKYDDIFKKFKNMYELNMEKLDYSLDVNKDLTRDYNKGLSSLEKSLQFKKVVKDYFDLIKEMDGSLEDLAYNFDKDNLLNKMTKKELYEQIQGLDKKSDFEEFIEEYSNKELFKKGLNKLYVKDSKSKNKLYIDLGILSDLYKDPKANLENKVKDYLDNKDENGNYKFGNDSDKDKMLCPSCLRMVARLMPSGVCKDCDNPGCGGNYKGDDNNFPPGGAAGMILLN